MAIGRNDAEGILDYTGRCGRFLARSGMTEAVEGASWARNVVIEFPSYESAIACWKSPEYQEARELRRPVSTMEVVIIEGYEGAQP